MGNFWGDAAGAFQKSYFAAEDNKRRNAEAKRDEKRFEWEENDRKSKDEYEADLQTKSIKVGDVVGGRTIIDGGASLEEANARLAALTGGDPKYMGDVLAQGARATKAAIPVTPDMTGEGKARSPFTGKGVKPTASALPAQAIPAAGGPQGQVVPPQPVQQKAALPMPEDGAINVQAPKETPVSGGMQREPLGVNQPAGELGFDPKNAVVYRDPITGSYKITDRSSARLATDEEAAMSRAAIAYAHGKWEEGDKIKMQAYQLIDAESKARTTKTMNLLRDATLAGGGATWGAVENFLDGLSEDNSLSMNARFSLQPTKEGGMQLMVKPDGTNLPAQPYGQPMGDPAQALAMFDYIVRNDFAGFQKQTFDQGMALKEYVLKQRKTDSDIANDAQRTRNDSARVANDTRQTNAYIDNMRAQTGKTKAEIAALTGEGGAQWNSATIHTDQMSGESFEYRTGKKGNTEVTQRRQPNVFGGEWVDSKYFTPQVDEMLRSTSQQYGLQPVVYEGVPGFVVGDQFYAFNEKIPTPVKPKQKPAK